MRHFLTKQAPHSHLQPVLDTRSLLSMLVQQAYPVQFSPSHYILLQVKHMLKHGIDLSQEQKVMMSSLLNSTDAKMSKWIREIVQCLAFVDALKALSRRLISLNLHKQKSVMGDMVHALFHWFDNTHDEQTIWHRINYTLLKASLIRHKRNHLWAHQKGKTKQVMEETPSQAIRWLSAFEEAHQPPQCQAGLLALTQYLFLGTLGQAEAKQYQALIKDLIFLHQVSIAEMKQITKLALTHKSTEVYAQVIHHYCALYWLLLRLAQCLEDTHEYTLVEHHVTDCLFEEKPVQQSLVPYYDALEKDHPAKACVKKILSLLSTVLTSPSE